MQRRNPLQTNRDGVEPSLTKKNQEQLDKDFFINIYENLYNRYGKQNWWPGDSIFEIMVGAILTQNTQWFNVKKAIKSLKEERLLEPRKMYLASEKRLASLIVQAGYYNIKAKRLKNFLDFLMKKELDFYSMRKEPIESLREELLEINGIGPETADSILLYALEKRTFVVDAYTRRLFSRLNPKWDWMKRITYDELKCFFEKLLPNELQLYNEFHALIVKHSKEVCKSKPLCEACILKESCHEACQVLVV